MTAPRPLISVIIPCYNQAHFLGEAIESIRAQTYPHAEIVVVDDGSTDDPAEVVGRYPGVRFFRQENQGPAAARNTGIRQSEGAYLTFLDADDRLLPDALEIGARYLAANPECAFVSGHCSYIAADGSPLSTPRQPVVDSEHYLAFLHKNYVWAGSTVLHRRECLAAVAGYNTSLNVKGAEDYELYLRVSREFPVFCHGETIAEYRQYETYGANVSGNPGLMLRSTLSALRGQWKHVKGDERLERVYREGIRHKKRLWGGLLFDQVSTQLGTRRERMRAVRGLLMLLGYDAPGLLRHIIGR
jgi:glycosyltransferase involved in cell wall biosynthesis